MYYSDDIIEEVRSRNDIVDVISTYVNLKRKGSSYFGLCPFHNEKTGSFSVSPGKQMYYCFGCGAGGNVISFIMQYENLTFPEAVQALAKRSGISLPEQEYTEADRKEKSLKDTLLEINKTAATHFFHLLRTPEGRIAYEYLHGKRKLSDETIRRFGLGYSSKRPGELYRFLKSRGYGDDMLKQSGLVTIEERGARDKFWNRAMFPIMDANSRVIGFGGRVMGDGEPKYLNSPETKLFDKSRNLYGLNYARSSRKDYFLLCEGYLDVISLHQAGFTNAVASLGTALTAQHCLMLKRYVKQVVLTYDSDGAGVNAARRAIPLLKEAGITAKILSMKPYKDPDEFINALGAEEYQKRIDNARNSFLWEIDQEEKMYQTEDPGEKTRIYHAAARKLSEFTETLERENYLKAVAREHMIPEEELRRLVNTMGAEKHSAPAYDREAYRVPSRKKGGERDDAVQKSQRLFLTFLAE
ncbi:MAG: DNA primase, partial [Stomatobaculum sp.]|nr:DNA primase [Stomatobaculum sp.]